MLCIAGHHSQELLLYTAAPAGNLEIQASTQAEHKLGVLVAVGDLVVAVSTQR